LEEATAVLGGTIVPDRLWLRRFPQQVSRDLSQQLIKTGFLLIDIADGDLDQLMNGSDNEKGSPVTREGRGRMMMRVESQKR
jgi:hypothetical protein